MSNLFNNDWRDANYQARAVLAYLQGNDGIEESYDKELRRYKAEPEVNRWHNCREQGYVISLRDERFSRQLNIAFFEHRNSDQICAIKWEQKTLNPPTIDNAEFGDVYKTKYDVSHEVGYGEASAMADWIMGELKSFWTETQSA